MFSSNTKLLLFLQSTTLRYQPPNNAGLIHTLVETIVNQFSFNNAAGKRGQDHSGQLLQTRHQGYSAFHLLVNNEK